MNEAPYDVWFDFASTYSYPAAMRVEDAALRYGCLVQWRPFLLGPIFKAQGWSDSPFNIYPVKGRYMWRDLERLCAALQICFRKPREFPRNSLLATRIASAGEDTAWLPEFARRVYTANFADDRDIAEPAVLLECLSGLTQDPAAILTAARGMQRLRCAATLNGQFNWASLARRLSWWAKSCSGATIGWRRPCSGAESQRDEDYARVCQKDRLLKPALPVYTSRTLLGSVRRASRRGLLLPSRTRSRARARTRVAR